MPISLETRPIRQAEEINTFCPVRFYLGKLHFDGLLDTVDSKGGTFFILTEEEQFHPGSPTKQVLENEEFGELILGSYEGGIHVACRIREIHMDQDGLFAYIDLGFMHVNSTEKKRLDEFIASLW